VIQKVKAAREDDPTLSEEASEEEIRDALKNLGDDLIEAVSDPFTWQIMRDPVKAADGFTYERRSIEKWIWQAQLESQIPTDRFGTPLSSVELTPDYTIRALVSSLIQKVTTARAASGKIQKHWRGFQVRKDTSHIEAKLALVDRQMEDHRLQISKHYQKLLALRKRRAMITTVLSSHTSEQAGVLGESKKRFGAA